MLSIQVKQPKRTLQLWFSITVISFSVEVSILSKYLYTVGTIRSNRRFGIDSGNIHSHFNKMIILKLQLMSSLMTTQFQVLNQTEVYLQIYQALLVNRLETTEKLKCLVFKKDDRCYQRGFESEIRNWPKNPLVISFMLNSHLPVKYCLTLRRCKLEF